MTSAPPKKRPLIDFRPPASETTPDTILDAFLDAVSEKGLELYPAQEEACMELMGGSHVVLHTPTGSGKSMVALAMHFKALCEGKRSYYTSPVKALVSEKFFALCEDLGPENVGMMTGDATINHGAPIICCTAEILANIALRDGALASVDYAVIDEFHYYSDKERGVAWQVPLLRLPQATFLLMSATLGDTKHIRDDLAQLTGKPVALVESKERPVPLDYEYRETPIHETIDELVSTGRAPIYIVNFTQRACAEQVQNLMSVNFCTKEEKKAIAAAIGDFRFDSTYGKEVSRFVRHGLGIHHAGLLPKYRLLVEQLAQKGLLKVILGTDTLGVGVNIPIRTVLFTQLCKFDGEKTAILAVRDFKQIAGRAGRKGFDDKGSVVCQAPEHVIENKRAELRFAASNTDGKKAKKRKIVKKKPPEHGYVEWNAQTFQRLQDQDPAPMRSRFAVSHAMMINLLQSSAGNGYAELIDLIARCHDDDKEKRKHRRRARSLFRSLLDAGIVELEREGGKRKVRVDADLQLDFSLNQTLGLFLVEALFVLDRDDEAYALNVLSLVESILENPKAILFKIVDKLKGEAMAQMKAEGVEYDERMERLEKITYPKPLEDFIYTLFGEFRKKHPWVGTDNVRPKGIIREMVERYCTFGEYVREYGLQRSEGVLLRQVNQTYRALNQSVPDDAKDDRLRDIIGFLRAMLTRTDSSLLQEWESLQHPAQEQAPQDEVPPDPLDDKKTFLACLRAEVHALVGALSRRDFDEAALLVWQDPEDPWDAKRFEVALASYFDAHEQLIFDHSARLPPLTRVDEEGARRYRVRQTLVDPAGDNTWFIEAMVDLNARETATEPLLRLVQIAE